VTVLGRPLSRANAPLIHGRVASGREVIVGSVLIIIGASLIAVTRRLIMIRPRLILIACSLIAVTRGLIAASLNTIGRMSRKLARELGAAGRTYENGVNLAAGWTRTSPHQSSCSSPRAQARLVTNCSGGVFPLHPASTHLGFPEPRAQVRFLPGALRAPGGIR
jgi:hypothetical protein